jgi:cobalt-precorrin 5A hydrolase
MIPDFPMAAGRKLTDMPDIITLSDSGACVARKLAADMKSSRLHFHETVTDYTGGTVFSRTADLVTSLFQNTEGIIFIGPCGVMVRAISPHLQSKLTDPPVVVIDVLGRWAVSLVSGHEGGANALSLTAANILGAEPVITTTSDAARTLIVGVGCRRECDAERIVDAVTTAIAQTGATLSEVRFLASADIKAREPGLLAAAKTLGVPLRLISSEEIRTCPKKFTPTPLAMEKVNLPAVAEPAALLAGRRTTLILPKTIKNSVTVAIARENSL